MEFLFLFLAGFGGIIFHIAMKFRDDVSKTPKNGMTLKERLSVVWTKFDLLGHLSYGITALLVILFLVALREELNNIGFPVTLITIPFYGYAADSAFKNLKPEMT